ncbi:type II secretion system protein [Thauera aromatica]|uniref:type II secretion system protein n=1 Tax=Thauera aromatica TaxID=59405 RepID=UPI001FFDA94B|nr:prepilin-type N-terminal cleavage/methylation domain-containing protein [Thauera aromatica]MCK2094406.1 type II secretion system GspH family protein [Thauera aromatica]
MTRHTPRGGFTLIELLVVMTIIATLLTLAVPRYFTSVERSKEAVLRTDLNVMREAIDKYYGDKGKYPDTLDELVSQRYLRALPRDPITDSRETWVVIPPEDPSLGGVYDVRSGAPGDSLEGETYGDW